MDYLETRLFKAYVQRFGKEADCPSQTVECRTINKKDYAVLSNSYRTLAVYELYRKPEINLCLRFRFLNKYPKELENL